MIHKYNNKTIREIDEHLRIAISKGISINKLYNIVNNAFDIKMKEYVSNNPHIKKQLYDTVKESMEVYTNPDENLKESLQVFDKMVSEQKGFESLSDILEDIKTNINLLY